MKNLTAPAIALAFALGGFATVANAASDVEKKTDPLPGNVNTEGHGQNPKFDLQDDKKAKPDSMMKQGESDVKSQHAPLPGNVNTEGHGANPQFKTQDGSGTTSGVAEKMQPLPGNVGTEGHGQNPVFEAEKGAAQKKQ